MTVIYIRSRGFSLVRRVEISSEEVTTGGPHSGEYSGENPGDFPTRGENQLRWTGGPSSYPSLLLLLSYDTPVRILHVILVAVCV